MNDTRDIAGGASRGGGELAGRRCTTENEDSSGAE
jgi:hypothetical protein